MRNQMPNNLPSGQGSFSKEGSAPEPGGTRYGNLATGYHTTVYEAVATNTGGRFLKVAVRGNQILGRGVHVPHEVVFGGERIVIGDSLLVGGIKMTSEEPEATMAWPFRAPDSCNGQRGGTQRPAFAPPPRPARSMGTVSKVHFSGRFCEVLEDRTGLRYFGHQSAFGQHARMVVGFRVTFTAASTPRGAAALDIKPQN